jgi:hypothetical protein
VLAVGLPFYAMCAHHLLPFFGRAHVAYLPAEHIVGFGSIASLVDYCARRPTLQENIAADVADALGRACAPRGVAVLLEGTPPLHGNARGAKAGADGNRDLARCVRRGLRASRRVPRARRSRWAPAQVARRGNAVTQVARTEGRVPIGERPDGSPLSLPYIRWHGEPGPHLYIGVTIHGDELTGQASLWRVAAWLEQSVLTGMVTAIPAQNPEGFNYNVRGIPGRTHDLNRSYPGSPDGETHERVTAAITEMALAADAAVDVHTAGWCMPYILLDPVADPALATRTRELAEATGITLVNEFVSERYEAEGSPPRFLRWSWPRGSRRSRSNSRGTATWRGSRPRRERWRCATRSGISASCMRSARRCATSSCVRPRGTAAARCSPSAAASSSSPCAPATT